MVDAKDPTDLPNRKTQATLPASSSSASERTVPGPPPLSELETLPTLVTSSTGSFQSADSPLPLGTLIADRYNILSVLGSGGMGVVYRAADHVLELEVALKILRPEMSSDEGFLRRFRHELLIARKVTHRHVVRIHDIGVHKDMPFMTMDLVDGESLRKVIKDRGALPLDEALRIFTQVAEGLAEAHRQGVIHRDLKPENIMINGDGDALITDFGVARSVETSGLTRTGEILGTPDYLSPEQARGEQVDGRSDLYTLAVIFLEMVSGKLPFPGGTLFEVIAHRMSGDIRTPAELGVSLSPAVGAIVDRCVANAPNKRYATADVLVEDLRALERGQSHRLSRAGWMLAALLLVVLAGFAVERWWSSDRSTEQPAATATEYPSSETQQIGPHVSLAVLPLATNSENPNLAWIAGALPEFLSQHLAKNKDVRILDRVQLLQILREQNVSAVLPDHEIPQLTNALGVEHLLFGTLREVDDHIEVELKVVKPSTEPSTLVTEKITEEQWPELIERLAEPSRQTLGLEATETSLRVPNAEAARTFYLALESWSRQEMSKAIEHLETTVEKDPNFTRAWLHLADLHHLTGRSSEAREAASQAVASLDDVTDRTYLEAQAQEAFHDGRLEEAQDLLNTLVERYPFDPSPRLELADAFGSQGRFPEAIQELQEASRIDPSNPRIWYQLGRYSIQSGDLQQAVDEYLVRALVRYKKLRHQLGQGEVYNALGVGYQRLGLVEEAQENYQAAVSIREQADDQRGLAASLYNLFIIHLTRGDFTAAESTLERSLTLHHELNDPPGLARLYGARGLLEEERGQFTAALDAYRQALRILTDLDDQRAMAESHNNIGFAYFQLAQFDNATLHFEKSLNLYQKHQNKAGEMLARQSLGFCQRDLGRWPEALDTFAATLKTSGEIGMREASAVALGNLGVIAHYQGRYDEADASLQQALAILTELGDLRGLVEFQLRRAEMQLEIGDLSGAEANLEAIAARLEEESSTEQMAALLVLRGNLHLERGEFDQATSKFQRILDTFAQEDLSRHAIQADLGLGKAVLASVDPKTALAYFERAAEKARQRRETVLTLRTVESLSRALIEPENPSENDLNSAAKQLDEALLLIEDKTELYARTGQLLQLRGKVETLLGRTDQAAVFTDRAEQELARVRRYLEG